MAFTHFGQNELFRGDWFSSMVVQQHDQITEASNGNEILIFCFQICIIQINVFNNKASNF